MRLVELFDTSADWELVSHTRDKSIYQTDVNGSEVKVVYYGEDSGDVSVDFYRNDRTVATGEGDAVQIFSVVVNLIAELINDARPETLMFMAIKDPGTDGNSRTSLYKRMAKRYAAQLGYKFETERTGGAEVFIFTRNDSN